MNLDEAYFSINEVAKQIGVVPATIRNWERQGLFIPKRSNNGYRLFDFHDIERLRLIRQYSKDENMGISAIKLIFGEQEHAKPEVAVSKKLLGKQWKEYRLSRGYLLDTVAKGAGISASYLSKIENAQANVSLDVLNRLASFYGESLMHYVNTVNATAEESPVVRKNAGEKFSIGVNGLTVESVVEFGASAISSMIYTVEPGCGRLSPSTHSGSEFLHILSGRVKVILNGDEEYSLSSGDSMSFLSRVDHRWYNHGKKTARILWVYTAASK